MRTLVIASALAVTLLAATGFTDCNQFHKVTVPAQDAVAPWIYNVGWTSADGSYQFFTEWHLSSPDDSLLAIASAMDDGGVKKLTMRWTAGVQCCQGNVCEWQSSPYGGVLEDTQPGGIGSVVSNGLWVAKNVKPRDFCVAGWTPTALSFTWTTRAVDFAGNGVDRAAGRIVYP